MVIFYVHDQDTFYYQVACINIPTVADVSWWIVPGTTTNGL